MAACVYVARPVNLWREETEEEGPKEEVDDDDEEEAEAMVDVDE